MNQDAPSFVLVEPDEDDRYLMREAIRQTGSDYSVIELASGADLISYLQRELHEKGSQKVLWLIILDFNMPAMSGLDVLKTMQQNELWKQVPVIILTANEDPAIKDQVLAAGASAYVAKPFSVEELADQMRTTFAPWIQNPVSLQ